MTELIQVLTDLQNKAKEYGIRISALSVHPDNLELLQQELLMLQKKPIDQQPVELVGIQLVPWYPETQRLQARMTHLKLVEQYSAYLQANGVDIKTAEGDLTTERYTELVYKFLGVDMGKLKAEQADIKSRMPERVNDVENLTNVVTRASLFHMHKRTQDETD